ncbi:hypothetical protein [Maribellus sediminis]|uniref:hypothetical protein n=1 Tax=Maribellus sediminis TaxID=2696285 RepID=UPI00142F6022|nr:hypothetical protein [Maribellus sediminis]
MQDEKKQLEVLLINYFRECYDAFPKGRIVPAESPDFMVKAPSKRLLGIELTRLHSAVSPDETQNRILQLSQELYERSDHHKLLVKVLFSEKHPIHAESELALSARLANSIRNAVKSRNERSFFNLNLESTQLPTGIEKLALIHHPQFEESVWESVNSAYPSPDIVKDIKVAIDKKEQKLPLYRRHHFDEYWLVISCDHIQNTRSFRKQNPIQDELFHSGFRRVFLFEILSGRVFELSE